jgi:hypothetical protein
VRAAHSLMNRGHGFPPLLLPRAGAGHAERA